MTTMTRTATMTRPRSEARHQSLLFPLGTCWCEHVIPVIEDMEPCPDCMEAYDPHDCPLTATRASVEELLSEIEYYLQPEPVS